MKALVLIALVGCTDLPNQDDPRERITVPCDDLLKNGNFDAGPAMWSGDVTAVIIDDHNVPNMVPIVADSGHHFAWFGGALSAKRTLAQTFDLPDGVAMLRLDAKVFVAAQTTGSDADAMRIQLLDGTSGAVLATPLTLTNQNADPSVRVVWKPLTVQIPAAAQHVTLQLVSSNDAANNTNFFFDTLTLVPSSCL